MLRLVLTRAVSFFMIVVSSSLLYVVMTPRTFGVEFGEYVLDGSQISCLARNALAIDRLGKNFIILDLQACPDLQEAGMERLTTNSAPDLILTEKSIDRFISFVTRWTKCLDEIRVASSDKRYHVNFRTCSMRPIDD